jgi:large subunit ribosomal protein L10
MTKQEKEQLIEELKGQFEQAGAVIACSYNGLTVPQLEEFRNIARKDEIKVKVIKNTLATLAMKQAGKEGMELSNDNIFIWAQDQVSASKVVTKFAEDNEKFKVKTAFVDGEVVDAKAVEAYSKLPGREELLGMLLSTWTAPARNLVGVLSGVQREFVTALNAIKEQKESA